nr:DUF2235 domain-containing protein [uncultured Desulfobacter sp.]
MKRLIVCCDGTWNTPEMVCPTNVVKIAQAIPEVDANNVQQIVFYDEGIGTQNLLDKYAGGALGKGIDLNVQQAYRFIALNYSPGDEIYLYGFSRGSYTVRSLAGMIGFAGMLERHQIDWIQEAYELYRKCRRGQSDEPAVFRAEHQTTIPDITFMGCWDTVEALGLPNKVDFIKIDNAFKDRYRFVNSVLGDHIRKAVHAVAIDEIRMEFDVTLMQASENRGAEQVTEEWFPGDHGSVGGGTPHKRPLSDAALAWMIERTRANASLHFDTKKIPGGLKKEPTIFFDNEPALFYQYKLREIPQKAVFHDSAIYRYVNLPHYREKLCPDHSTLLAAAGKNIKPELTLLKAATKLKVGEKVHAIIYALEKENNTHVIVEKDAEYRISALPCQCWKDGKLDPCGPSGWSLDDPLVKEQVKIFGKTFIKFGNAVDLKVLNQAKWFELIGRIKEGNDLKYDFRIGDGSCLRDGKHKAKRNGTLYALANDAKALFVDKYGNNRGWIIIQIERI